MLRKITLVCFGIICIALSANAAAYSFEDATVPAVWDSVTDGSLSISTQRYKLQTRSLQWSWSSGSVLTVINPDNLSYSTGTNTRASSSGIDGWIYNENPSNEKLIFEFYSSANVKKCSLEFNLNFRGWRRVCVRYYEDLRYDRTQLQTMKVVAPSSGSGSIYFDAFEFTSNATWERISDMQYTVRANANDPDIDNFLKARNTTKSPLPTSVSSEEKAAYDTIVKRFESWYLGTDKYATNPYYLSRYNSLNANSGSYVSRARTKMSSNPLIEEADGVVTSKGLYPIAQTKVNDVTVDIFRTYSEQYLLPLAFDWRLNNKTDSRDYLLKMYSWYNNQGWADGSALGSIRFEKLRSGGYFHSVFLIRDELSAEQRSRETETIYWYSLFGNCYATPEFKGETADNLRTLAAPKLIYALMQTDDKERARALHAFSQNMENSLSIAPGYLGTFKSDFSGYHHRSAYANSYAPDALHVACLVYYLLHDTPYKLSPKIYRILKGALLEYYDFICAGYDVPQALTGRFPANTQTLEELIPAMAFLSLSNPQPDADLVGTLKRLWKPAEDPVKKWLSTINTDITFKSSLGTIELVLDAMNNEIAAMPTQQGNKFFPYAGTMVSKSGDWQLNIKGFSKYIWDFEGGSNENLYGRYMSNGTVQIVNASKNLNSHNVGNADWDWARFPGATAKYLSKTSLDFGGTYHRNFSDKAFLGGVAADDSIGFFSVQLHDNTFDKSFYANKSVFIFGKNSYHVGSNIRCTDVSNNIETTLFQSLRSAGNAKINGATISGNATNEPQPTLQDSYGNTFLVHEGNVDLSLNTSFVAATINHGKAPTADSYQYSLMFDASSADIAKMKNAATRPIQLISANDTAHIIQHTELNTTAYAVYIPGSVNYGLVDSVNTAALILVRQYSNGKYQIVFSDPGMRRKTAARNDALSYANAAVPSDSFDIYIRLNKALVVTGSAGIATVTPDESSTTIRARVTEGQSHVLNLVIDAPQHVITASAGTGGMISPSGSVSVFEGHSQTFTITADAGYEIDQLMVDGANATAQVVNGTYTFTNVTAAHTISATFKVMVAKHIIIAGAGTGGTIMPGGMVSVNEGDSKTFTITANAGYGIDQVLVDGTDAINQLVNGTYTFTNVTGNHNISARFKLLTSVATENAEQNSLHIYPNPTNGELTVDAGDATISKVELLDLSGRVVYESAEKSFNIAQLPVNTYIVRAYTSKGIMAKKVVKK